MNRRTFLKLTAAVAGTAALPPAISQWAEQKPEWAVEIGDAVVSLLDADNNIMAMGVATFQPASMGISSGQFELDVIRTGKAVKYKIARNEETIVEGPIGMDTELTLSSQCMSQDDSVFFTDIAISGA